IITEDQELILQNKNLNKTKDLTIEEIEVCLMCAFQNNTKVEEKKAIKDKFGEDNEVIKDRRRGNQQYIFLTNLKHN
ncbi:unnamed protein product, partial [Sphenostylis stenocarpa]